MSNPKNEMTPPAKKILYVDMDGVVANFDEQIKLVCPDLHTNTDKYPDDQAKHDRVEELCRKYVGFFEVLNPIEGAINALEILFKMYDVYFLSTPMWSAPASYTDKRLWIEKHFGPAGEKRLILSHRKDLMIGDFLIDDRTAHGAGEFKGCHIHFGTGDFPDWLSVLAFLTADDQTKAPVPVMAENLNTPPKEKGKITASAANGVRIVFKLMRDGKIVGYEWHEQSLVHTHLLCIKHQAPGADHKCDIRTFPSYYIHHDYKESVTGFFIPELSFINLKEDDRKRLEQRAVRDSNLPTKTTNQ